MADFTILRDLRRDGKLIPFVGSGLSITLGLPSWFRLLDIIAEQLDYDPEVFKLSGNNLLQLAEYYVASKGKRATSQSIKALDAFLEKTFQIQSGLISQS